MRFHISSGHVAGDYPGGQLAVTIRRGVARERPVRSDVVHFSVPPDFHTHHDAVAAAMLTRVGKHASTVEFNFPVSPHCAELLQRYYPKLERVEPIDPSAAPRRPGRYLGLNFSGGIDSTAVWLILRAVVGDQFRVVTSDYGGPYAFEAAGFGAFRRDVTCRTDLREKGFDWAGRFNSCVPLLYADYLDLRAQVTGHPYTLGSSQVESLRDGHPPSFLNEDLVLLAGGLEELHLLRPVFNSGPMLVVATLAPELIRNAFAASARPG